MAPSSMFPALAALTCLMLAHTIQAATLPPATYSAANIVENIEKDCPVKSVPFDKNVFNADNLVTLPDVLSNSGVSKQCQEAAVTDLANCFRDGSLQIMTGCCTTACATAVKKSIQSGCFAEYQAAICAEPKAASVKTGLLYAAKRCGNYAATCAGTTANSTASANATTTSNSTTPTTAANSTEESNTPPVVPAALTTTGNRSTASQTTTAAPPASATASPPTGAAGSPTISMALSLAAAVTAFVVTIVC